MTLLLDTHFVIWAVSFDVPSRKARMMTPDASQAKCVSVVSVWEIAIKIAHGKLVQHRPLDEAVGDLLDAGARLLPVTLAHAAHVLPDPPVTRDPFDRMLLAQCDVEGMRLLTVDRALAEHRLAARA